MKILFVISHTGGFRFFEGVIKELISRGHKPSVHFGAMSNQSLGKQFRPVVGFQKEHPTTDIRLAVRRRLFGLLARIPMLTREYLSYAVYLTGRHPTPHLAYRWVAYVPTITRPFVRSRFGKFLFARASIRKLLNLVERLIPASKRLVQDLEGQEFAAVIASPLIAAHAVEVEYVKAALRAKIPTAAAVLSWDHLSSKGTFHVSPDRIFVWNQSLADEAVAIHGMPDEKIRVTGAPVFDFWFDMQPQETRDQFMSRVGLQTGSPYVVYACSSTTITGDETGILREFVGLLRANPKTESISVLVRPHPLNPSIWQEISEPGVSIYPIAGDIPDDSSSRMDYVTTLRYALAIIGVNTSAMVEAAAADIPCITVVTDRYEASQAGRAHFKMLMEGDYVEIADGLVAGVDAVATIASGVDSKADERKRFAETFIRPKGIGTSAATIMADEIEEMIKSHL